MKGDSRNGDLVSFKNMDKNKLQIDILNQDITSVSKWTWMKFVKEKTKEEALRYLVEENSKEEKTKHIVFEDFKMSDYLWENKRRHLSLIMFSVRSQTLNIKKWKPWNYEDNLYVKCQVYAETMGNFVGDYNKLRGLKKYLECWLERSGWLECFWWLGCHCSNAALEGNIHFLKIK